MRGKHRMREEEEEEEEEEEGKRVCEEIIYGTSSKNLDIEDVFEECGGYGYFQLFLTLVMLFFVMINAMLYMSMVYIGVQIPFICFPPELNSSLIPENITSEEFLEVLNYKIDECSVIDLQLNDSSYDLSSINSTKPRNCERRRFDTRDMSSIVSEFDLVCERRWLKNTAFSALFIGCLVGSLGFGILADRWLPESPRWLLSKKRYEEAENVFKRIAKSNKRGVDGMLRILREDVIGREEGSELNDSSWFPLILAVLGKFGCTASWDGLYLLSAEIFPTIIRNSCMGIASTFSSIGAISAPLILGLSSYASWLPLSVFGVLGIVSGLLTLLLPEVKDTSLPQTVEDMENL
ncbi:organic cation transporter protein-like [Octopus vulgaris]|uniref:Organic cation transporter protein-like n=1 Tax=Octopus vulgaris TaxID=6645 RepID=A0AA36FC89_OCTVU|nr:organic cation transporter protein-like [Octopus vulgaris]